MFRLICAVLLMSSAALHASVTAAWKVPIESIAADYKTNTEVRKLDKPPGESAFFQAGDELWDVAAALRIAKPDDPFQTEEPEGESEPWAGEWAVWNARSGLLVARGSYDDIFAAQQGCGFDRQPRIVKTLIEWRRPGHEQPYRSLSLPSQNGERTLLESEDVSVEQEVTVGGTRTMDARFALAWEEEGASGKWSVTTATTGDLGTSFLLARHGNGDCGWEIHARVLAIAPDGTALQGSRWIVTTEEDPNPWLETDPITGEIVRQALEGDHFIAWYEIPPGVDAGASLPCADLDAPDFLRKWIKGPFIDCSGILRDNGVAVDTPGFFSGMSAEMNQLVVAGSPEVHAGIVEILKQIRAAPEPRIWVQTNPDSGNWGLTCRSGEKAMITFTRETKEERAFLIEPLRIREDAIDLKLNFDFMSKDQKTGRFEGRVPGVSKEWREIGNVVLSNGSETKVSIRAEISKP